ncbi:MAG TPA: hypothetical protein VFB23_00870 [Candidatus Acidoferrales bacterium]|nr:hypothetical protein [Candidatus Acidoferrales bacterium]
MTMGEFDALVERHNEAHRRAMIAAGTIAAAIYNANPFRGENARILGPLDFVPGFSPPAEDSQSLDDQVELLTKFFGPPRLPN